MIIITDSMGYFFTPSLTWYQVVGGCQIILEQEHRIFIGNVGPVQEKPQQKGRNFPQSSHLANTKGFSIYGVGLVSGPNSIFRLGVTYLGLLISLSYLLRKGCGWSQTIGSVYKCPTQSNYLNCYRYLRMFLSIHKYILTQDS